MANPSRLFRNIGGKAAVETEASRAARAKAALEEADKKTAASKERVTARRNQSEGRATEKRGAISKSPVSATDVREAKTEIEFTKMQRRIDEMEDGNRKKMMQQLLDRQLKEFENKQKGDLASAQRKSAQSSRDRAMKGKVTLPEMPFKKGGMAKSKYAKGGMAAKGKK